MGHGSKSRQIWKIIPIVFVCGGFIINHPLVNRKGRNAEREVNKENKNRTKARNQQIQEHFEGEYDKKLRFFLQLFVDDYLQWHKVTRREFEMNSELIRKTKLLVYRGSTWNFGLGDRIRGALDAFLVSAITKRLFLLDLEKPYPLDLVWRSPLGYNFTYDAELFHLNFVSENDSDVHIVTANKHIGNFEEYNTTARVVLNYGMVPFDPRDFLQKTLKSQLSQNFTDIKTLRSFQPSRDQVAAYIMKRLFKRTSKLNKRLEENEVFKNKRFLSLHARMGVGVGEIDQRFNYSSFGSSKEIMASCIGEIAGRVARKNGISRVLISTDTREVYPSLKDGIKFSLPFARISFMTGKALHLRRMKTETEENFAGFFTTFVDVTLLSRGERIVYFKSGFADVATWLGGIQFVTEVTPDVCINGTLNH